MTLKMIPFTALDNGVILLNSCFIWISCGKFSFG